MTLDDLVAETPVLWHLTSRANVGRITATRSLESAAALMAAAGDEQWLRQRRLESVPIRIGEHTVWLRDQAPLHPGAVRFEGGWDFARLVEEINQRVYFWPGDHLGPVARALGNFKAFRESTDVVCLRLPLDKVRRAVRPFQLQVTSVNVGALRSHPTSGLALRGPSTFVAAGAFPGRPRSVQEVVIRGALSLEAFWKDVVIS